MSDIPTANEVQAESDAGGPKGIGWAVKVMWIGKAVRRAGWNGKGMWLKLTPPADTGVSDWQPFVYMKTAQGTKVPWLCSQTDLLAIDWEIAEDA